MTADYDLDRAYEIHTADDARRLYDDWAQTYDDSFGAAWGYVAPQRIAETFRAEAAQEDMTPVLDIGAGTGLVAAHLGGQTVDAFDISAEMLAVAAQKGLYRQIHQGDLLAPLDLPDGAYGGVVSSGTFTHGHVGPACLPELLRVTRPGALFCCGTIPTVFDAMGFGSALAGLVADGVITPVRFRRIGIYEGVDHAHAGDLGIVMLFRKL